MCICILHLVGSGPGVRVPPLSLLSSSDSISTHSVRSNFTLLSILSDTHTAGDTNDDDDEVDIRLYSDRDDNGSVLISKDNDGLESDINNGTEGFTSINDPGGGGSDLNSGGTGPFLNESDTEVNFVSTKELSCFPTLAAADTADKGLFNWDWLDFWITLLSLFVLLHTSGGTFTSVLSSCENWKSVFGDFGGDIGSCFIKLFEKLVRWDIAVCG